MNEGMGGYGVNLAELFYVHQLGLGGCFGALTG